MNNTYPDPGDQGPTPGFDSLNCIDLVIDGPGDTTVRPARPLLRQLALAERERIARWQKLLEAEQKEKTTDDSPKDNHDAP